jgi:DNA recombination protein RmuC
MSELLTLTTAVIAALIGGAIMWFILNQRTARLLEATAAESAATLAAAEAREVALNESAEKNEAQMHNAFKVAAGEALRSAMSEAEKEKEKSFTVATSALSQSMKDYVEALDKVEKAGIDRDATLRNEVTKVSDLGIQLADETRELSLALRGDSQAQGAWGEVVVENLLQNMGFEDGRDYHKQMSETAADGTRKRTDFVLNLPGDRQVVIDSKVSLTDYVEYTNAEDEATETAALKAHCASIRKHADNLASKNYEHMEKINTLDFVLMVVPLESAFLTAMHADVSLYENLTGQARVKVVTGTTLMLTLRLIQEFWHRENRSRNQEELVKRAGQLHDKVVNFLENFNSVGFELGQAKTAYDHARDQLIKGTGNIVWQTEEMAKLGAKTKKDLRTKSGVRALAEEAEHNHLADEDGPNSAAASAEEEE